MDEAFAHAPYGVELATVGISILTGATSLMLCLRTLLRNFGWRLLISRLAYVVMLADLSAAFLGTVEAGAIIFVKIAGRMYIAYPADAILAAVTFGWGVGFVIGLALSVRDGSPLEQSGAPPQIIWSRIIVVAVVEGLIVVALVVKIFDASGGTAFVAMTAFLGCIWLSPRFAWWLGKFVMRHTWWSAGVLLVLSFTFAATAISLSGLQ